MQIKQELGKYVALNNNASEFDHLGQLININERDKVNPHDPNINSGHQLYQKTQKMKENLQQEHHQNEQDRQNELPQVKSEVRDVFMSDAISLIGMIYECAKAKNIPAQDFEAIVMQGYEKTIHMKNNRMPSSLAQLVTQTNRKTCQ